MKKIKVVDPVVELFREYFFAKYVFECLIYENAQTVHLKLQIFSE